MRSTPPASGKGQMCAGDLGLMGVSFWRDQELPQQDGGHSFCGPENFYLLKSALAYHSLGHLSIFPPHVFLFRVNLGPRLIP